MQYISYDKKDLPVFGQYDVVIVGGGTSGAVAALSALKEGLTTLIIEKNGCLGGMQTTGMVTPMMPNHMPNYPRCALDMEINAELAKFSAYTEELKQGEKATCGSFNPIFLQAVLDQLITKNRGNILFHTTVVDAIVVDGRIDCVIVYNTGGLQAVRAKCFIDCTADAELCRMCGVGLFSGNQDGINQNVSLRFEMAGVDIPAYEKHMAQICSAEGGRLAFMTDKYEKGYIRKDDIYHFQTFEIPGKPNCLAFNCPELGRSKNTTDPLHISQKMIEGRQAVIKLADFCVRFLDGFQNAYISAISPVLGLRETNRIDAEYMLTISDVFGYRKFEDGIAVSNYPLDAHGEKNFGLVYNDYIETSPEQRYYEIPLRSLIPKGVDNLLCVGRCIGTDFLTQSTTRVQTTCRYMGEAAGIACRFAIEEQIPFRQLQGQKVRRIMAQRGAEMLK